MNKVIPQQAPTIVSLINSMRNEIARALPRHISPDRITRIAVTCVRTTPKLAKCTSESFLGALMNCAQLGLEPNTPLGQCYLIPYENRRQGITECQFQMGYKGLLDLAFRTNLYRRIGAEEVYDSDFFEYERGTNSFVKHREEGERSGSPIKYYAEYETLSGGYAFKVMTSEACEKWGRKYSKSYERSPWKTNFEWMAKKTVLRQLLKIAPISTELGSAATVDNAKINYDFDGKDMVLIPEFEEEYSIDDSVKNSKDKLEKLTGE